MNLPSDVLKQLAALRQVALAYEELEADMIGDNECWESEDGLPKFTDKHYERAMEIQLMRNKALAMGQPVQSELPLVDVREYVANVA